VYIDVLYYADAKMMDDYDIAYHALHQQLDESPDHYVLLLNWPDTITLDRVVEPCGAMTKVYAATNRIDASTIVPVGAANVARNKSGSLRIVNYDASATRWQNIEALLSEQRATCAHAHRCGACERLAFTSTHSLIVDAAFTSRIDC